MRKLLAGYWLGPAAVGGLALAALISWILPPAKAQLGPPNQILCNNTPVQPIADVATGTTVKSVSEVTGKVVYICGWHVTGTAASTFKLSYGTGANCATRNVVLTPTFNVSTTAPSTDHVEFASLSTPVSQGLCVTVGGTGPAQVYVWFAQF